MAVFPGLARIRYPTMTTSGQDIPLTQSEYRLKRSITLDSTIRSRSNVLRSFCCDVAVAQINYPSLKHNTQDSIEQARDRSHDEDSSQIFMLDDMQFGGGLDVI